jgi:hypothetical protein
MPFREKHAFRAPYRAVSPLLLAVLVISVTSFFHANLGAEDIGQPDFHTVPDPIKIQKMKGSSSSGSSFPTEQLEFGEGLLIQQARALWAKDVEEFPEELKKSLVSVYLSYIQEIEPKEEEREVEGEDQLDFSDFSEELAPIRLEQREQERDLFALDEGRTRKLTSSYAPDCQTLKEFFAQTGGLTTWKNNTGWMDSNLETNCCSVGAHGITCDGDGRIEILYVLGWPLSDKIDGKS